MKEPSQHLLVSVVIVCHNDGKWLPRCLESLRAQTIFPQIEIIVVDNASEDGSDQLAQRLIAGWPRARFLETGGDYGFCVAHNRGAGVARGEYLYLLSPDTWLEPDCLSEFVSAVQRAHAGGAGGTVLEYENNDVQARGSHGFDAFGNPVSPRRGRNPEPLFCIAGFYFIRRDLFLRLGLLDEKFFMYGEEMDLSWRIWLAGEKLIQVPAARLHHRGAVGVNPEGGTRQVENRTSDQKRFLANRNSLLVIAKNCQHLLLGLLVPCGLLILLEGAATLLMTRSGSLARRTCWDALADFWRLRGHIREKRREIRAFRRRSDFWMLRFLRFGFGRRHEIQALLQRGFPKFTRS